MTEYWELTLRFEKEEDAEACFNAWSLLVREGEGWSNRMILRHVREG